MKKIIRLIGVIFILIFLSGSSGCPPRKPAPRPTPPLFYEYLDKGESAEAKKDLAKALDYYKEALIAAPRKSNNQVKAHQRVLRVERKMNKAKEYCQEYKTLIKAGKHFEAESALKQMRQIWPFYSECDVSLPSKPTPQSIQHVGSYKILDEKPLIHKIRRGEIISKLCQKYYGRTENYKLVHIITHYNKINSKSLVSGQKVKFPWIQLNGNIYRPEESLPKPTPNPTKAPKAEPNLKIQSQPTPIPTPELIEEAVTPMPTPEPVSHLNKAATLFEKGRYADAITALNNVPVASPEKEDSSRLLSQCHFRLAQISMEKTHYREARDMFHKALEICQRLQGTDLPSECGQIEDLVKECGAQIKTKAIEAHIDKGRQLLDASRFDSAVVEFEKVIALEPHHKDALEYLYLTHFRKANRLRKNKAYRQALEGFMTAWQYNQNCEECQLSINKIKGVLYTKAKALENELDAPNAPAIKIFQEQIEYYTIINQVDPNYEDVAKRLKKAQIRKKQTIRLKKKK